VDPDVHAGAPPAVAGRVSEYPVRRVQSAAADEEPPRNAIEQTPGPRFFLSVSPLAFVTPRIYPPQHAISPRLVSHVIIMQLSSPFPASVFPFV